ncbi:hypothetical protein HK405_010084 [Cladochytrium tenue]|nr:hypothetical protein HK405_010084 [Cladochytrium tenue]
MILYQDVAAHNTAKDCWIILAEAGRDATRAFSAFHPPDLPDRALPASACLGVLDKASVPLASSAGAAEEDPAEARRKALPPLSAMMNMFDFESAAFSVLSKNAWAYYSSGADDEITLRENRAVFQRIWFRPRILVDVSNIDLRTTVLGVPMSMPIYITACALAKLGHPEGETVLARAAGTRGVVQMMPTLASCSLDEMIDAAVPGQNQWFQLYVNSDRAVSERIVRHAEERGVKGIFVTVDAPQLGRREKDMRVKFDADAPDAYAATGAQLNRGGGAARAISSFIDSSLSWSDLAWLRSITKLPLGLKGVQTAADAVRAARSGLVQAIVVSNHGGRQLDTAPSGVEALVEIAAALRKDGFLVGSGFHSVPLIGQDGPMPDPVAGGPLPPFRPEADLVARDRAAGASSSAAAPRRRIELLVDGGFRRGSDVLKALAIGASAVGIGRPGLYAMSAYGQVGVERMLDLFADDLAMNLGLAGCPRARDASSDLVDSSTAGIHAGPGIRDSLADAVYDPLRTASSILAPSKPSRL